MKLAEFFVLFGGAVFVAQPVAASRKYSLSALLHFTQINQSDL